jgi:hypothetical protein
LAELTLRIVLSMSKKATVMGSSKGSVVASKLFFSQMLVEA